MVKEGLFYTREHEWAKIEGEIAIMGITDYAQQQLGEITYAELPKLEKQVQQNDELGVVESSKSASDFYSPVAGKVTEVNGRLESQPELINEDCYGEGWLCKFQLTSQKELENLMDAKKYENFLKGLE